MSHNLAERKVRVALSDQLQSTPLKGLLVRLRYEDYRNNFSSAATLKSAKEQHINIDYTWKFK